MSDTGQLSSGTKPDKQSLGEEDNDPHQTEKKESAHASSSTAHRAPPSGRVSRVGRKIQPPLRREIAVRFGLVSMTALLLTMWLYLPPTTAMGTATMIITTSNLGMLRSCASDTVASCSDWFYVQGSEAHPSALLGGGVPQVTMAVSALWTFVALCYIPALLGKCDSESRGASVCRRMLRMADAGRWLAFLGLILGCVLIWTFTWVESTETTGAAFGGGFYLSMAIIPVALQCLYREETPKRWRRFIFPLATLLLRLVGARRKRRQAVGSPV